MILSLVNVKGGVGKTTTAVSLAAAFAREGGLETLLVDLDPQGSASFSLGVEQQDAEPSSADLLLEEKLIQEVIRPTRVERLGLVTGSMRLAATDRGLARKRDPERRLVQALIPVRRRYDMIVIDCPPGLNLLTLNGLLASKAYVVPVTPHDLDMEALNRCLAAIDDLDGTLHRRPALLGILLTMVDHRTRVTEEVVKAIRGAYGHEVLKTEIPINVRLAEAPAHGLTIFDYESWSPGAQAYRRLGGEILRRSRNNGWV